LTYTRAQFPARKAVEGTYEIIIDGQRRFLDHARLDVFAADRRAACSCDTMSGSN
jgi:hypothetical protein